METLNPILKVPDDRLVRESIRIAAARYVSERQLSPPAAFSDLQDAASDIIQSLDYPDEYLNYATVMAGNETWRPVVEATPYDRRLLIIPQCLKNTEKCRGTFDDLGLLCAGCNGCNINDILAVAEELGYTTLVAEGTTVALKLVEEGAIDAVIGLSCMPVLQRSFSKVSKTALPVIGIPLLYDGCEGTNADFSGLISEIRAYSSNSEYSPLSVSLLLNRVNGFFTKNHLELYFPGNSMTEKLARDMMKAGGRRMRPLLSVLGYLAYSEENDEKVLSQLAMIIECFHKASLIHDDIEDDEDMRYNTKTLHKSQGIPVAINTGDFLIGKGYRLLCELPVSPAITAKCLRMVSDSHLAMTIGQGEDIMLDPFNSSFTSVQAVEMFRKKSGEAIKVALQLGAIAGGASEAETELIEEFALNFGISYQIRDDLGEFNEDPDRNDVNDYPFLLALLNEEHGFNPESEVRRTMLNDTMLLREILTRYDIPAKAEAALNGYISNCYSLLDRLQNQRLRLSLYGVIGKVFRNFPGNNDTK